MSRMRRTTSEWAELLKRQATSGQGVKEWCMANEVNVNSMYNKIAKFHKGQAKSTAAEMRNLKKNERMNAATKDKTHQASSVEWKELKPLAEQQRDAPSQKSSIYIEIGGLRIAADAGYPVTNLAALCKELIRTC